MLVNFKTKEIRRKQEFEEFFAPVTQDLNNELFESIRENGLKSPLHVCKDNILVDGYRRLQCLIDLGIEEVLCIYDKTSELTINERISINQTRPKTPADEAKIIRTAFKKYPKKQGQRNDGVPYKRHDEISGFLNGRFKGDDMIKKLECIVDFQIDNDILIMGVVAKGWKVETCYDYINKFKKIDEDNKYGFTEKLTKGEITVSEANKFIQERKNADKHTCNFVIPDKVELYNGDAREIQEIFKKDKKSINLIVTSIMYWKLRNYNVNDEVQLGHEKKKEEFAMNIANVFNEVIPFLAESANVCINIGETYNDGIAEGIPYLIKDYIERYTNLKYKATIIWSKKNPRPESEKIMRPINSTEWILWFVVNPKKSKYNMLTFPKDDCDIRITHGSKDVTYTGKVAKKSKSLSKSYAKLKLHIHEQEVEDIITTSVGKNHEIAKISSSGHPAAMSPYLPTTLILMQSDEGDVVCDPFSGSAMTGKISLLLNRRYVGIEKCKEYYDISTEILKNAANEFSRVELDEVNSMVFNEFTKAA